VALRDVLKQNVDYHQVRDNFESKRPEYVEKISATMGEPWTVEVNVNEIFPYATDSREKDDIGSCIAK
jgi:hypothetical protein